MEGHTFCAPRVRGETLTEWTRRRPDRIPLSYAQQPLWFLNQLRGTSTEYHIRRAVRLTGDLDQHALERAVSTIVERHEVLRTHFSDIGGTPVQVIAPAAHVDIPIEDLSGLDDQAQQTRIYGALSDEATQPLSLARGPLLRMKLFKLACRDHVLLRTLHHIVSDGWSQTIFSRELAASYEAHRGGRLNTLPPLVVQYADFALWQRDRLEHGHCDEGLAYWTKQLAGVPETIPLPTDRPRPAIQTLGAETFCVTVPEELTAALTQLARANRATLYMMLLAALAVVLARYSGHDDVVIGSPVANRHDERLERLIGIFVNALVMRVHVRPAVSFQRLLAEVRSTALKAYQYQDVPFAWLVDALAPKRDLGASPIFQVQFALQNAPRDPPRFTTLAAIPLTGNPLTARFDIEVYAWEHNGYLEILWLGNRDLFDRWRIAQMAKHYVRVLETVVADPQRTVGRIDLLDPQERQRFLYATSEAQDGPRDGSEPMVD